MMKVFGIDTLYNQLKNIDKYYLLEEKTMYLKYSKGGKKLRTIRLKINGGNMAPYNVKTNFEMKFALNDSVYDIINAIA